MSHEPECEAQLDHDICDCAELRSAYQRGYTAGYNAHARAAQHWQDTHGAYRDNGDGTVTLHLRKIDSGPVIDPFAEDR